MSSLEDIVITTHHRFSGKVHDHKLIKNEDYHAREDDLCYVCGLLLHKSGVVYHCVNFSSAEKDNDCAHFFLHKTCALLPLELKHSGHKYHVLLLQKRPTIPGSCNVCGIELKSFAYYCHICPNGYQICVACVLPLTDTHISTPYHAHKLTLVPRLSNFRCDVCHSVDTDFSYMCYTCPFWIHLGCSKLQAVLECEIHHKHPLTLAYSLPQNYRSFPKPCRICNKELDPTDWLYYCLSCRFFAHTKCATSPPPYKEPDYPYRDSVQIPVPEHDPLLQQCIKKESISWLDDDTVTPPHHIKWLEDDAVTPPSHINHWSHNHQLLLKNKSELSSLDEEGKSPICNGCTDSIFTNDDVFFECRECNYVLHRHCAQFPKEMMTHKKGYPCKLVGIQDSVYDLWSCAYCRCLRNGTQVQVDIPWHQEKHGSVAVCLIVIRMRWVVIFPYIQNVLLSR
ncbi:hypothetical protein DCAR_0314019 [Daucus carota subsp. sativus]|uniref:Phorbol-ester/DAG-type domain-containing protein n=1 Tax=Daucus carota subsp. sativus TaxID=79200 RepID=A0AAF0WS27_DAUCS|nr:PREDICTED: uncharacterized protein LOC108211672 isoform X3 [Daucus carota subsp. sativus]WOG94722.1 hypothetical protein DCAR_0314019 [Daucus carota subsp. sativus]